MINQLQSVAHVRHFMQFSEAATESEKLIRQVFAQQKIVR